MWKQWGVHHEGGNGCDPVYNRRIYAAQSHFDAHLLHDDFARTLDAEQAKPNPKPKPETKPKPKPNPSPSTNPNPSPNPNPNQALTTAGSRRTAAAAGVAAEGRPACARARACGPCGTGETRSAPRCRPPAAAPGPSQSCPCDPA